ncbi:hypothetical protein NDU88_003726 [Pleurodeles waltl]|uniref:Uncharacterized protein n=1 Tax=Pleurodeles waltl TaxID=8319 RepID=A0AAV7RF32_PLEWA|nr:hypothetical protein NDU88_003726 [Pleurodeles waltl]
MQRKHNKIETGLARGRLLIPVKVSLKEIAVGRATAPTGFIDLHGVSRSLLNEKSRCSETQLAKLEVTSDDRQEVKDKKVDWREFDGAVGVGEHLVVSFVMVEDIMECELDYDDKEEDLEEEKIPY